MPYQLAKPAEVTVCIHMADGKQVRELALGQLPAGVCQDKARAAYWDGTNEQGEPVADSLREKIRFDIFFDLRYRQCVRKASGCPSQKFFIERQFENKYVGWVKR